MIFDNDLDVYNQIVQHLGKTLWPCHCTAAHDRI